MPATKAGQLHGDPASLPKSSEMGKPAPSSPKRSREEGDDEHSQEPGDRNEQRNKGRNKYKQRTFQHGSRKHKNDKRNDMGRWEYL